jgi:hypothetical protein
MFPSPLSLPKYENHGKVRRRANSNLKISLNLLPCPI